MQTQAATTTTPTTGSTDFWYDEAAAEKAVSFFPRFLKHIKGEWAGRPVVLEPWQAEITRKIFGSKRDDGTRQYRTVYIEIPRKQGKSTWCSGIAPLLLFADKEPGAEVYSAAADRDQAGIVFEAAKQMVSASPDLLSKCEVYRRSIFVPNTASSYKVLSADAYTKHGLNAHGVIFDELHTQPNRDLWDVLTTSTGARRQPLVVAITTAGYDRHSLCYEIHDYAIKVRDGIIEDSSFLPVIFAADEKDDWKDPKTWIKANPNFGVTVKKDYFEQECKRAQEVPAYENTFKRLHLNIWTEQATRAIPMDQWDAPAAKAPIAPESLNGRKCFGGMDLAKVNDLSALVLVFPPIAAGELWKALSFFWVPADDIRMRSRRDRVPYDQWRDEGLIFSTPGNVTDYSFIFHKICELAKLYQIQNIAFDRTFGGELVQTLQEEFGDEFMVEMGQGFLSMASPTAELLRAVKGAEIQHGGNKVLRWNISNLAVKQDPAGNVKPDKEKSTERIDGAVALIMAHARARSAPAPAEYGMMIV